MKAALENFSRLQFPCKSLILGDMLELGEDSLKEHKQILSLALSSDAASICLVGDEFRKAYEESATGNEKRVALFHDSLQLREYLAKEAPVGRCFLIKGSRGMKLERVLDVL